MSAPQPEHDGASVVLLGSFNPAIFQPAWFAGNDLLRKVEADAAEIELIHAEATKFNVGWCEVQVTRDRFLALSSDASSFAALRDLAVGVFRILEHTPIKKLGVNRHLHLRLPSEEEWHAVGHVLAPKEPWQDLLEEPGLQSLLMRGKRSTDGRSLFVKVEPSRQIHPGVYLEVNCDIAGVSADTRTSDFIDIVQRDALKVWDHALTLAQRLLVQTRRSPS